MKAWEKLVASFLVVVLEESESEREKNGEEPTVLRDSRVFVEELEKIKQRWKEENNKNEKQGEEIMLASWDISAMYPSLKIEYIVRGGYAVGRKDRTKTKRSDERCSKKTQKGCNAPFDIYAAAPICICARRRRRSSRKEDFLLAKGWHRDC